MSEIIISSDELKAAAQKVLAGDFWEEGEKPSLGQVTKALGRWFENLIQDRLDTPNEYVFAAYSTFEKGLEYVKEDEARDWCGLNRVKIEKVPAPDSWPGQWVKLTSEAGTEAEGFNLFAAYQKLVEAIKGGKEKCYWCGNDGVELSHETVWRCDRCGRPWRGEVANDEERLISEVMALNDRRQAEHEAYLDKLEEGTGQDRSFD